MLHEISDNRIKYIDTAKGWINESIDEFVKKWTGILLMSEANERSGEKSYAHNRQNEKLAKLRLPFLVSLSMVLLVLSVAVGVNSHLVAIAQWFPLFFIKFAGLVLSVFLLIQTIDSQNPLVNKICNWGTKNKKINCLSVIESPASKLFSWLSWAEIGAFYFMGGFFTLLFSLFNNSLEGVLWFCTTINLLALPYTFYSIYYQAKVVGRWCALCLLVQLLLWLEFVVLYNKEFFLVPQFSMIDINIIVLGFILPVIFWIAIKPGYVLSQKVKPIQYRLNRFEKNSELMRSILSNSKAIEKKNVPQELILGNPQASNSITLVLSLFCAPCGRALGDIRKLLKIYQDDLKVIIVFSVRTDDDTACKVAANILSMAMGGGNERVINTMSSWYENGKEDVEKWMKNNRQEVPVEKKTSVKLLNSHMEWCKDIVITKTPTVFVNDYELPDGFHLGDIELFLDTE